MSGEVIPTTSSDTLKVDGLALRRDDQTRLLLANLSSEPQQVTVHNLSQHVKVRQLDETNAEAAMRSPEDFRAEEAKSMQTREGSLELCLLPYAIIRIDGT